MSRIEVPCEVCQNIHETHRDSPGVPVSLGDQEVQNEQGNISPKPPEGILIEPSHAWGHWFESSSLHQNVLMKDATPKTPHESAAFSHIMRHF